MKVWAKKRIALSGRKLKPSVYVTLKIDEDKIGPGLGDYIAEQLKTKNLGERLYAALHPLGAFETVPPAE